MTHSMPAMMETKHHSNEDKSDSGSTFASRLKALVKETNVSAFARKVGLSESLIRKYIKGSEPSLSRADQIARKANVSLEWLATGCGYQYRQAEVVDQAALQLATELAEKGLSSTEYAINELDRMTVIVSVYQFLRTHKKADGYLDEHSANLFAKHAVESISSASESKVESELAEESK